MITDMRDRVGVVIEFVLLNLNVLDFYYLEQIGMII